MISNMTGSIDREVTPCHGRLKVPRYLLMSALHLAPWLRATLQPAKRRTLDLGGINE